MDWTLFWQIAGPIIGLLGIGATVFLVLWARREKVRIKTTINYTIDGGTPQIKVYWSGEFHRSGGKDVRYVKQIQFKPDKQAHSKLCELFELPKNGEIAINERLKLPRDVIVSSYQGGERPLRPVYRLSPGIPKTAETRKAAEQMAEEVNQRKWRVRLVWEDGGKTKWKTISKEDSGKWVRL